MTRLVATALFALGLALAGTFSGTVIAEITTSTSTTTAASTAPSTTAPSTTAPSTTAPPTTSARTTTAVTTTPPAPRPPAIPAGVRVAGVEVGGLTPRSAVAAVRKAFTRPLTVVVDRTRFTLEPAGLASAYIPTAVARARAARPRERVRLVVAVRGSSVRRFVAQLDRRLTRPALDASLTFRGARPVIRKERPGRTLDAPALTARIVAALASGSRRPIRVRTRMLAPEIGAAAYSKVIVIDRAANRLSFYVDARPARTFPVGTGMPQYPTPSGTFRVVVKYRNPWWYPPTSSSWAQGLEPVPPGPSNPLGTRWMGISSPGIGIHGTNSPASIGYSVSHGCIRMQVPDAEWLFERVDIGTTVRIV